ncbi:hypothetical protein ACHAXH_009204 [Discostella pseudostelligera]|jgi:tRNA pseudouridine32 synthase/23S rRNA pseudouridine746 synthase
MRFFVGTFLLKICAIAPTLLFVGGFITSSSPPIDDRRSVLFPSSKYTYLHVANNDVINYAPEPPTAEIEPSSLLMQAYADLNVTQLRDLLRANGAKVSGNKRELINRVESILVPLESSRTRMQQYSTTQPSELRKDERRNPNDSLSKMTINELKDLLRQKKAHVSGNKRELIQRLLNLREADIGRPELQLQNDITPRAEWSILEPTFSLDQYATTTTESFDTHSKSREGFTELPLLSGLLFINKPAGYSTLPTKQQLDNPTCPAYPCLSDIVKEWLHTDPKGRDRLHKAIECEEVWWDYILQQLTNDPQLKKLQRERDSQLAKRSTFDPRPVHRLDIDTSGIVCIALTPYTLRAANMLFEKKTINNNAEIVQKEYVALVEGYLDHGDASAVTVDYSIGKVWIGDHNEWACDISGNGSAPFIRSGDVSKNSFVPESLRHAVTTFRVVPPLDRSTANTTRVELTPQTGRGHQLRLHMASIGHPIVGDYMHGSASQAIGDRLCLHASELSMEAWCMSSKRSSEQFQICRVIVHSSPPF